MAKKSKEFENSFQEEVALERTSPQKAIDQKIRQQELAAHKRFKDRMVKQHTDLTFVDRPPKGFRKMSEVLQDFVGPYTEDTDSYAERNSFMELAMIAWNLAVFPEEVSEEMMTKITQKLTEDCSDPLEMAKEDEKFREVIGNLIARKKRVFPDDLRIIQDFQLTEHEGGFHLSVAYAPIRSS